MIEAALSFYFSHFPHAKPLRTFAGNAFGGSHGTALSNVRLL
ncbi:hypothetical protein CEV33_2629 [Brucella grignonensis]|uniref:Uncharacterized protein n=1 Tax=Brucella grignonensis TaxID=94627 RepID=A0A256F221_9HYPH|nr:hypothetical protein CEV33_2629 [Brucella grignonensis]